MSLDAMREEYKRMNMPLAEYDALTRMWRMLGACIDLCDTTGQTEVKTLLNFARREIATTIDEGEQQGLWMLPVKPSESLVGHDETPSQPSEPVAVNCDEGA